MNILKFKNPTSKEEVKIIRGTYTEIRDLEKAENINLFKDGVDAAEGSVTLTRNENGSWTITECYDFEETGPIGVVLDLAVRAGYLKDKEAYCREWIWYSSNYWGLQEGTKGEQKLKAIIDANVKLPGWTNLNCEVHYATRKK